MPSSSASEAPIRGAGALLPATSARLVDARPASCERAGRIEGYAMRCGRRGRRRGGECGRFCGVLTRHTSIHVTSVQFSPNGHNNLIVWASGSLLGDTNNTVMIAGPCSIESEEQIQESSALLKELNLTMLLSDIEK